MTNKGARAHVASWLRQQIDSFTIRRRIKQQIQMCFLEKNVWITDHHNWRHFFFYSINVADFSAYTLNYQHCFHRPKCPAHFWYICMGQVPSSNFAWNGRSDCAYYTNVSNFPRFAKFVTMFRMFAQFVTIFWECPDLTRLAKFARVPGFAQSVNFAQSAQMCPDRSNRENVGCPNCLTLWYI